jgi:hypothetical protein
MFVAYPKTSNWVSALFIVRTRPAVENISRISLDMELHC